MKRTLFALIVAALSVISSQAQNLIAVYPGAWWDTRPAYQSQRHAGAVAFLFYDDHTVDVYVDYNREQVNTASGYWVERRANYWTVRVTMDDGTVLTAVVRNRFMTGRYASPDRSRGAVQCDVAD